MTLKTEIIAVVAASALAVTSACAHRQQDAQGSSASGASQQSTSASVDPGAVQQAEQALNDRGYNAGAPDGRMDPATEQAVAQFQQARGLQPTGQLDPQTLAELGIQADLGVGGSPAGAESGDSPDSGSDAGSDNGPGAGAGDSGSGSGDSDGSSGGGSGSSGDGGSGGSDS